MYTHGVHLHLPRGLVAALDLSFSSVDTGFQCF